MTANTTFRIAVFPGDGIGGEVMEACLAVLDAARARVGGFRVALEPLAGGAAFYRETGTDITDEAFRAAERADAILFGAMGLPEVRFPDGTEIAPHLRMRDEFRLFAGVRPVKAFPNAPSPLADPRAAGIDLVILRESTEGLFASRGKGVVEDDREARDTMVITRATSEQLFDFAFDLAAKRRARGRPGRVTCVDKSNVFVAYAFFRKVFDERAALYPDLAADHHYIDAMALDLVLKPWDFDVVVAENMFGDILSDLGAGIVGGMGMAPCGEIGEAYGLFQPSHGSAPDIAGTGRANPTAMILSGAMMLDWLGDRHAIDACSDAAALIEGAVERGYADRRIRPAEFGGDQTTAEIGRTVCELMAGT